MTPAARDRLTRRLLRHADIRLDVVIDFAFDAASRQHGSAEHQGDDRECELLHLLLLSEPSDGHCVGVKICPAVGAPDLWRSSEPAYCGWVTFVAASSPISPSARQPIAAVASRHAIATRESSRFIEVLLALKEGRLRTRSQPCKRCAELTQTASPRRRADRL